MSESDAEINLSDGYVVLLEDTIKESRSFREKVKTREEETRTILSDLSSRVNKLCETVEQQSKQPRNEVDSSLKANRRRAKLVVPRLCRTKSREMYNELLSNKNISAFNLAERATSSANGIVIREVSEAVRVDQGGDKCPWSAAQIREALMTYHRTLKDNLKRNSADHSVICRRSGRQREKIARRRQALEMLDDWPQRVKVKVAQVLTKEFTSSDESGDEEDENGDHQKVFFTKRLSWTSKQLVQAKEVLDDLHRNNVKGVRVVRRYNPVLSSREAPENAPKWTLKDAATFVTSTPRNK